MKKLAILLTIALLLSMFTGCQNFSAQETATATDSTEDYSSDPRYYMTTDNGYAIIFSTGVADMDTINVIAGQAFGYPGAFGLYACKDGVRLMLEHVYEQGFVSKEEIIAIREVHNQRLALSGCTFSIAYCCPAPIFQDEQMDIKDAWARVSDAPFGTWYTEDNPDGDWRSYGSEIYFYCGGEQEEVFTTIQIGDVTFSHPTTFQLYVEDWRTDDLLTPEDYYNKYGDFDQVEEAAQLHKQTNDAIYGEGWDSQENTQ